MLIQRIHLASALMLAAACSVLPLMGQHPNVTDPSKIIDGSRNPDLIPDEVAIELFLLSLPDPPNVTGENRELHIRAKLRNAMLIKADEDILVQMIEVFATTKKSIDDRLGPLIQKAQSKVIAQNDAALQQELKNRKDLLTTTWPALLERLSASGRAQLLTHLRNCKYRMKIVKG